MRIPSNELACQALFLHAADEGRGKILFGEDWRKTCDVLLPFVESVSFPELYLEFPLAGDPFLDVTVLYGNLNPGTCFRSEAAAGTEQMIDWFIQVQDQYEGICFGYELDAGSSASGSAGVHFQHRSSIQLAKGFFKALGEEAAGQLYMNLAARMPDKWTPAFCGMFRGRPDSPLRVCGYLDNGERKYCAEDPSHLEKVFRRTGFSAYDNQMLERISAFLSAAPNGADYQFDVFPDGRIGDTFAIDADIGLMQSEKLRVSFDRGAGANIMKMLESWGAADSRWPLAAGIALSSYLPVEDENGETRNYALMITPKWIKARWRRGVLQNAKLYCEGKAGILPDI